jgi:hypothetical protein
MTITAFWEAINNSTRIIQRTYHPQEAKTHGLGVFQQIIKI